MNYKYLFGPVLSRRLGRSLGVDIVPYKTCTLNCVYCECGRSAAALDQRKPYITAEEIINELKDYLAGKPELDYITFSGGGEPTLNSDIGKVIEFLKEGYPQYKIALLTNGTLLKKVADEVKNCDVVIPSLDAASTEIFNKINRPCPSVKVEDVIDGIKKLKKISSAKIWIEVFIVPGLNDSPEEISKLKEAIIEISPDMVQLNTLDRPGAEGWVKPASAEELSDIKEKLKPLNVSIIGGVNKKKKAGEKITGDIEEKILLTLKRRPCTAQELTEIFSLHINTVNNYLRELEKSSKIKHRKKERGVFYLVK